MRRRSRRPSRVGIRKVTVPNLSGLTRTQAQSLLSSLGLAYSESTTNTSDSGLSNYVNYQSISNGSTVTIGTVIPFIYYQYQPTTPVITYGPCEAYGDPVTLGTGTQCSGDYYQEYTDYRYNTRKKIYSDGVWDGSSYSTLGCGTTDSRTITSSTQVNGQCGYVTPPVITYGPCEAYGSGTEIGSGNQCNGNYYQSYIDYSYSSRKKIYLNGVWDGSSYSTDGCSSITSRTITSSAQVNGQCGYTTPITYTYGPCEIYGSPVSNLGSGNQCSGTYYQEYTDYRYNTRKKIYADGVWDGSSYTTSGCGTSDSRVVTSSNQINGLCGYVAPCSISSYSDWSYSNITWSGSCPSGTESGTAASRSRTDNCNNTYNESGSYAVTRSCTPPSTTTYGSCQAYGDAISGPVSSRTACDGTYTVGYQTWTYAARRTILINGSWDGYSYDYGCGNVNQEIQVSYQQLSGSCGCCAPVNEWYCTESYQGGGVGNCSYTKPGYNDSASGTGYSRQCTFGTSYPACQSTNPAPICTSYKYNCKSYDVTNPASNNYFQCYTVGECAANNNSDGSRTTCCATYA